MVFIMAQCSRIGAHTGGCKSQVSWRWRCLRRLPSLPRSGSGFVRQDRRGTRCLSAVEAVSEAEDEANRKRWKESGGGSGDSNEWKWTLNWDYVTDDIIVGSCPRSPEDLDRIVDEAGATAVLSLQCDLCLEALGIDWHAIRDQGVKRGIVVSRVPIRDFDHGDQTLMLPEAVRTLAMLLALSNRVYVHCTAGINRATLTTLGYLTFVQGWELNSTVKMIKEKRPQAHPYIDCWKSTKARILHDRTGEVVAVARQLSRGQGSENKDPISHWLEAENRVVTDTFKRQLAASLSLVSSLTDVKAASLASVNVSREELEKAQKEVSNLKLELEREQAEIHNSLSILGDNALGNDALGGDTPGDIALEGDVLEDDTLRDGALWDDGPGVDALGVDALGVDAIGGDTLSEVDSKEVSKSTDDESLDASCYFIFEDLAEAKKEIEALKQAVRDMAEISSRALSGELAVAKQSDASRNEKVDPIVPDTEDRAEGQQ